MELHNHEVVIFRMNDYLMSLENTQDQEIIRKYDGKTARVFSIDTKYEKNNYYTIKFPNGFKIKKILLSHLEPIRARKFKSKKRG